MTQTGRFNYARLTNKSGGTLTAGMQVIPDSATNLGVKTSTSSGDLRVFATCHDASILDNADGLFEIHGAISTVLTSATVARGNFVKQGTTAGKIIDTTVAAAAAVAPPVGTIGIALTGVTGAGSIVVFLFPAPSGGAGVTTFVALTDVPAAYTSKGDYTVHVNHGATALAFKYPEVFDVTDYGALGDDSTDDYTAIAAAITALAAKGRGTLYFPVTPGGGIYRTATTVQLQSPASRPPMHVIGDHGVQVRITSDIDTFYNVYDDSQDFGDLSKRVLIENLTFKPVTSGQGIGIHERDTFGLVVRNCTFTNLKVGREFESYHSWNESYGDEDNEYDNCTTSMSFVKTTGNTPAATGSFQGGRVRGTTLRTASGGTALKQGTGANLYGSSFDFKTIWPVGNNCIGLDWDGDLNHTVWHGVIDLAGFTPSPAWAVKFGANVTNATLMQFDMQFSGTFATGEQESGAVKNATPIRWFHSAKYPYGGKSRAVRVQRTSTQTIGTGADAAVSFDASLASGAFDESGYFASAAPTKLTIPWDGTYAFGGQIIWDSNTTGRRDTKIRLNGSSLLAAHGSAVVGANELQCPSGIKEFAAGDYIELVVFQDSGGNRTVIVDTLASSVFWIYRIGEGPAIAGPQ